MWRRLLQMCWMILVVERSVPVFAARKEIQWENQMPDDVSVVTEISVREVVNGRAIQRKPTQDELRLVADKFLERASRDFNNYDIFPTSNEYTTTATVEDFDSDDADSDIFDDWNDEDEDEEDDVEPRDMEAVLSDGDDDPTDIESGTVDFDDNRDKTRYNNEMDKTAIDETNKNDGPNEKSNPAPGEPPSRDYRKFFHTEKKNFSNVKEVKIVINEKEGDFFDDDEDALFMQKPSSRVQDNFITTTTQASVLEEDTDKFDMIKKILAGNETNDFNGELTTPSTFQSETLRNIISDFSPKSSFSDTTTLSDGPGEDDKTTAISISEDEQATGVTDFGELVLDKDRDDLVTTTLAPEAFQETFPAIVNEDFIVFKAVPEEYRPHSVTEAAHIEEISVITPTSGNVNGDVGKGNREDTSEDDTTTSTILPVTLENTVSSVIVSETDKVFTPTIASDSERGHGVANETEPEDATTEVLAENGISVQDISEIMNLAAADGLGESDFSNIKDVDYATISVFKEFDIFTNFSRDPLITIPADTSTEQILLDVTSGALEELATFPSSESMATSESSSVQPSYTTIEYNEASTESVNIGGSTETSPVTISLTNMSPNTSPSSAKSISTEDATITTVVDQTTLPANKDEVSKNNETPDLTPSEVESILNAQLEEYDEDDYDTKEGFEGWTIFSGNEKKKSETSVHLDETDDNILEEGQMTPVIRATILNNSAEFSVKISKKDNTFYIPATAYVKEQGATVNITWRATGDQNNSLAMRVFENEKFYVIKEIILCAFIGNKFSLQQKLVAINPDPILDETMPGRTRVVMMTDGTYITFSNVEFLKIGATSSDRAGNSAAASRNQKLWHFEVASISIVTILIVAVVLYVVALRKKTKITLREKDELPQVTHC